MIDALFGSKTRVKLLKLFLSNPETPYYVREITRIIDEQINSVRRELSNMVKVGLVKSESVDNKLFYQVDTKSPYFLPLQAMFAEDPIEIVESTAVESGAAVAQQPDTPGPEQNFYSKTFLPLTGAQAIIIAGKLVRGSTSPIDVLLVGQVPDAKLKTAIKAIERREGAEVNYTVLTPEDFFYRQSVRDRFLGEIVETKHKVIKDVGRITSGGK